jgi:hypothetical protein
MEDMNNTQLDRIEKTVTEILKTVKMDRFPIDIKWLTEPQVMKLLNLTKRAMKDIRRKNVIRTSSATGRNFLYYKSDVENYMFENSVVNKRRTKS